MRSGTGTTELLLPEVDLLRFTTAGSVDDGKSTLIGRLLYDTKSIFQDQMEAVEKASRQRGEAYVNLALLTDGLRAEREQNITIDVAYRYFATPKRKFIIADTPGHEQHTRNMITGASTAELAVILVDARKGVSTQSKRHGFLASLLGIPHLLIAINKMDLVDFDERVFDLIRRDYMDFATKLATADLKFIPISALHGDNIVAKSAKTPWYDGPTLLHHLQTVPVGSSRNLVDFRLPVQMAIRPNQDFRGFAGRIASGTISPGEEVVILPSGVSTRVRSVETPSGPVEEAAAGEPVVVTTEHEVDIGRGDMMVRRGNVPLIGKRFECILCWLSEEPLDLTRRYRLMHTTRQAQAYVSKLHYRIDVDTLHRQDASTLGLNDIGRAEITASVPLFFDPYEQNRETGGFILVDPHTNATVSAGMIRGEIRTADAVLQTSRGERLKSPDTVWEPWNIPRDEREAQAGHRAAIVWLTGLPGSGKSTIAKALERSLFQRGVRTVLLDGDQVRHGLCADLGFSAEDRKENIRRVGEVGRLFFEAGHIVICAFVSPFAADRSRARSLVPAGRFLEVFVDTPIEVCRERDPKGLYEKAEAGVIAQFTGISSPYEAPADPEVRLRTVEDTPEQAARQVVAELEVRGMILGE